VSRRLHAVLGAGFVQPAPIIWWAPGDAIKTLWVFRARPTRPAYAAELEWLQIRPEVLRTLGARRGHSRARARTGIDAIKVS
jgi:hypothetical protein